MNEPNCEETLAELYLFLDREIGDDHRVHVEEHLRRCAPCLEAFDFEADLRRMIGEKCRDSVPDGLRSKIMDVLAMAELQRRDGVDD